MKYDQAQHAQVITTAARAAESTRRSWFRPWARTARGGPLVFSGSGTTRYTDDTRSDTNPQKRSHSTKNTVVQCLALSAQVRVLCAWAMVSTRRNVHGRRPVRTRPGCARM